MDQFQQFIVLRNVLENANEEIGSVGGFPKGLRLQPSNIHELDYAIHVRDYELKHLDAQVLRIAPPWCLLACNIIAHDHPPWSGLQLVPGDYHSIRSSRSSPDMRITLTGGFDRLL